MKETIKTIKQKKIQKLSPLEQAIGGSFLRSCHAYLNLVYDMNLLR